MILCGHNADRKPKALIKIFFTENLKLLLKSVYPRYTAIQLGSEPNFGYSTGFSTVFT